MSELNRNMDNIMQKITDEKLLSNGQNENDVVSSEYTAMATEQQPSVSNIHQDYCTLIDTSGAGSVSALTLNDSVRTTATSEAAISTVTLSTVNNSINVNNKMISNNNVNVSSNQIDSNVVEQQPQDHSFEDTVKTVNTVNEKQTCVQPVNNGNNNNLNNNKGRTKGKRRRRKSKQKVNVKPYKKSNWKFHVPRDGQRKNGYSLSSLAPYNTNRFLMEEHMAEILTPGGRYRDSSFSVDSDENLYDEEEFLSKEFSDVYENARAERLEELSKQQLIQEYLQLEASYEKLSNNMRMKKFGTDNAKDAQNDCENQNHIRKLENHIKELSTENMELRRQMADIRNRERRSRSNSRNRHHKRKLSHNNRHSMSNATNSNNNELSTEDSESDSTSTSSSSNSDSDTSNSSINRNRNRSRSRSRSSCTSKSSLSAPGNMSGISEDEETAYLLNGCDPIATSDVPVNLLPEQLPGSN